MAARIWSADVRAIGDRIVALSPENAGELQRYLDVVHGLRPGSFPFPSVVDLIAPNVVILSEPVYDVVLESVEPVRRIPVIQALRGLLSLGLREARDLMEQAPSMIAQGLQLEEAERFGEELRRAGGQVGIKERREESR